MTSQAGAPCVHQVLATLGYGDAIGHEVLGIQRVLRGAGYTSEIFVETADPRLEPLTLDYREMIGTVGARDILIHHFSIGSRASRTAYALAGRMALVYHNITPPEYFLGVHKDLVKLCFGGRRELTAYIDRCDVALGDSEYNRAELEALGFRQTGVLPVVPDFSHLAVPPDRRVAASFDDGWTNVMFVGRVIPNKKFENVIRAFHAYRTRHNPRSRLLLVGSYSGFERYLAMLHALIAQLGTPDVHFTGHVSNEELTALYEVADLFLCASEHEGFCVPIVEAFHKGVPVVAYAATAVPATMDGGGVLYETQDPFEVARLMAAVLDDQALEAAVVDSQDRALGRLRDRDFGATLLRSVQPLIAAGPRNPPEVAWDFWAQFNQFERLEELRQFRPALFRALPEMPTGSVIRNPGSGTAHHAPPVAGDAGATGESRNAQRRAPDADHRTPNAERRAPMIVNQWVPAAHRGDAIGDSARVVRGMLRRRGHQSDLFALTVDDDLRDDVRLFEDAAARTGDVTIFHFALPSPMTAAFATLPGLRVLQYHNITPAAFFAPYDPQLFRLAALGRQELQSLAGRVHLALGDSDFNRQELQALGFEPTGVLPIAVDTARITEAPRRPALDRILGDGLINILFVGRIVPNKRIEDHIRLAELYKRNVDSYYRFIFVGRHDGVPRYYAQIQALIAELQMLPDRFWFTGPVPDVDLAAFYRWADVYVSLSEHEGFCVPLVEAMAADVPVLAYAAGAVPETLGGAGVLFTPKDLELAAEMLGMLVYDRSVRERVLEGQRRRMQAFTPAAVDARLGEALGRITG